MRSQGSFDSSLKRSFMRSRNCGDLLYSVIKDSIAIIERKFVERSGSGVELRTLDYENPGSNPCCGVKTLGKFFHSTLLQFTQLFK